MGFEEVSESLCTIDIHTTIIKSHGSPLLVFCHVSRHTITKNDCKSDTKWHWLQQITLENILW